MIDNLNFAGAISGTVGEVEPTNARRIVLRPGTPGTTQSCCYKWVGWSSRNSGGTAWSPGAVQAGQSAQLTNWWPVMGLQWLGNRTMAIRRLGVSAWSVPWAGVAYPLTMTIAAWRCPSFFEQFATTQGAASNPFSAADNFDSGNTLYGASVSMLKTGMPNCSASQRHHAQGGVSSGGGIASQGGASGGLITWYANDQVPLFTGQTAPAALNTGQPLTGGQAITDAQPFGCYTFSTPNEADIGHTRRGIVWLHDSSEIGPALELDNGMGVIMRFQFPTGFTTTAGLQMSFHLDWEEYFPSPTS